MTQYQRLKTSVIATGIAAIGFILLAIYGCGDESTLNISPHISDNATIYKTPGGYRCTMPRMYALYSREWDGGINNGHNT